VKRMLLFAAIVGLAGMLTPKMGAEAEPKNLWCHYPPGQWTGNPETSKVLILDIAVSADPGHLGHSPRLLSGNPPADVGPAEGVYNPTAQNPSGCPLACVNQFDPNLPCQEDPGGAR